MVGPGGSWTHRERESGHRWLAPVILATQEAEIRRIYLETLPSQKGFVGWLKVKAVVGGRWHKQRIHM
jgi:hypothetical protein